VLLEFESGNFWIGKSTLGGLTFALPPPVLSL